MGEKCTCGVVLSLVVHMQLEKSLRKRNSLILTETSCGDKEERQGKMKFSLVAAHPKPSVY